MMPKWYSWKPSWLKDGLRARRRFEAGSTPDVVLMHVQVGMPEELHPKGKPPIIFDGFFPFIRAQLAEVPERAEEVVRRKYFDTVESLRAKGAAK